MSPQPITAPFPYWKPGRPQSVAFVPPLPSSPIATKGVVLRSDVPEHLEGRLDAVSLLVG